MARFVYRNGEIVPIELAGPRHESRAAPQVISDIMADTRHMADGKYYSSKSQFRAATKVAGCIEVGNELPTLTKPRRPVPLSREQRRNDIRRALYQLRNR